MYLALMLSTSYQILTDDNELDFTDLFCLNPWFIAVTTLWYSKWSIIVLRIMYSKGLQENNVKITGL